LDGKSRYKVIGPGDDRVDADGAGPLAAEQLVGRAPDALAAAVLGA